MYFDYIPVAQICRELGLTEKTVYYHVSKKKKNPWKELREKTFYKATSKIQNMNIVAVEGIIHDLVGVLAVNSRRIASQERDLSIEEMERLSKIVGSFDGLLRLSAGLPTDIRANMTLSQEALVEIIRNNDFIDYDEVQEVKVKEISH